MDDLQLRSHGIKRARSKPQLFDTDSVLRLGDNYYNQRNRYEVTIHSLTIWARKLSEDEVEARFTKGKGNKYLRTIACLLFHRSVFKPVEVI